MSKKSSLFFCYKPKLKKHLMDKGHRYIFVDVNKEGKTFWLFERTEKLTEDINNFYNK